MVRKFHYVGTDLDFELGDVVEMRRNPKEVKFNTMVYRCPGLIKWSLSLGFIWKSRTGEALCSATNVKFYRSTIAWMRCYYMQFGDRSYIWLNEKYPK